MSDNWRNDVKTQRSNFNKGRKENIRFGKNKGKSSQNLVIDEKIQEATPEHLRIEIDKIFDEFLGDPEKTEYIFPSDLNNLQRKYIHCKAQKMNVQSKSVGREPNRNLHITKKPKQVDSQSFQVYISDEIYKELQTFVPLYDEVDGCSRNYPPLSRHDKIYSRINEAPPVVPAIRSFNNDMEETRQKLPIFDKRESILQSIANNQVTIICSETGSGKTTQIPQYILEDATRRNEPCKIICTQPRRISTIAAAERVVQERGEKIGGTVGYHIRLESKCGIRTNLVFCTVGVFLRNLMCGSNCLKYITHVIIDEIHERDKLSDFTLICLRQNLKAFPKLRVILMSATLDTQKFQTYFGCNDVLSIPGRLFPIKTYFLEDVLCLTTFLTPQMRQAMIKVAKQQQHPFSVEEVNQAVLSDEDQINLDHCLEAYINASEALDYMMSPEEATANLMQLFISEDVPVDQQHSQKGCTALMLACYYGDVEFVSKLCTLGASYSLIDKMGKNAYDYARTAGKSEAVQLMDYIRQHKATSCMDLNTTDPAFLLRLYDMTTPDDFIDYELIVNLIKYICGNSDFGSILVFLPGYDEIMRCNDEIAQCDLSDEIYKIFFLHSSMNMRDQVGVFKPLPGKRKIILSTNIAETSITVEDVVFVIDLGRAKEKVFDSYNKLSNLQTQFISRSCAKQRQGRAGRVGPGVCFRLYSAHRYNHMAEERVPEILRVSLEELCLHAKIIAPIAMNIYGFLCLAPDPPTANSVQVAIENLQALGALDKEEDLTRLGEYLAQLAIEPRLGKMLLYSCIFRCLEPVLTLCAAMSHKDPFQLPPQANLKSVAAARRRELMNGVPSDHLIYLVVFQKWQEEASRGKSKQFCLDYFVSESTMNSVLETRRHLLAQVRALGFINKSASLDECNQNSSSWGLVKAVMSAAFFPNVAHPLQRGLHLATRHEQKIFIHNSSACATKNYEHWCFYDEMMKNKQMFMVRGITLCTPFMVSIMCGVDILYPSSHSVNIDEWLEFYYGDLLAIRFRQIVQHHIQQSLCNPQYSFDQNRSVIASTLAKVMDYSEEDAKFPIPGNVGMRPKFLYKGNNETAVGRPQWNDDQPQDNWRISPRYQTNKRSPTKRDRRYQQPGDNVTDVTRNISGLTIGHQSHYTGFDRAYNGGLPTHHNPSTSYNHASSTAYSPFGQQNQLLQGLNDSERNLMDLFIDIFGSSAESSTVQPRPTPPFELEPRAIVKTNQYHDIPYNDTYSVPSQENDGRFHETALSLSDGNNDSRNFMSLPTPGPSSILIPLPSTSEESVPNLTAGHIPRVYLIILAKERRNIEIAQSCNKWVFSPQTEKNILNIAKLSCEIRLIFYVRDLSSFMGVAEYKGMIKTQRVGKPTAAISWIYCSSLHYSNTRHLVNPFNKPICESIDGVMLSQNVGDDLMKIYESHENHN